MSKREVTEMDFRSEEFRNAKVEDYEFRGDGKVVRKDRWEMAIHKIRSLCGGNARDEFEIPEVIQAVEALLPAQAKPLESWTPDLGPVAWWCYSESFHEWVTSLPWIGTPEDIDWPGHHTHFSPLPAQPMTP